MPDRPPHKLEEGQLLLVTIAAAPRKKDSVRYAWIIDISTCRRYVTIHLLHEDGDPIGKRHYLPATAITPVGERTSSEGV